MPIIIVIRGFNKVSVDLLLRTDNGSICICQLCIEYFGSLWAQADVFQFLPVAIIYVIYNAEIRKEYLLVTSHIYPTAATYIAIGTCRFQRFPTLNKPTTVLISYCNTDPFCNESLVKVVADLVSVSIRIIFEKQLSDFFIGIKTLSVVYVRVTVSTFWHCKFYRTNESF